MAIIMIFLFTMLFMWGVAVYSYLPGSVNNGKYVLGITIPVQYRKEEKVQEILRDYHKKMRYINGIGLLACVPVLLLNEYMSIDVLLLLLWYGLLIYFHQENVERCARKLYSLKQKNGWLVGNPHVVRIDTALSGRKDTASVSVRWLFFAWLIGLGSCLLPGLWAKGLLSWTVLVAFIGVETLFFLIWLGVKKAPRRVVCSDAEVNGKLDHILRFEWSRCMVIHSYGIAAFTLYMNWKLYADARQEEAGMLSAGTNPMTVFVLAFGMIGSVLSIYFAYHNVKKEKEKLLANLAEEGAELYGDDDEYWLNGYPKGVHPTGFTEKRIGVGWTFNASLKSSAADKAILVLGSVFVAGICLFLIPFDFARVRLEVEDNRCRVSAASMNYSFALDDIGQITLVEEKPSMSKKNGYDSNRLFLGDFRVQGYGTCKVFAFVKNDMAVRVDTPNKTIWLNGENEEETQYFYEMLQEAAGKVDR